MVSIPLVLHNACRIAVDSKSSSFDVFQEVWWSELASRESLRSPLASTTQTRRRQERQAAALSVRQLSAFLLAPYLHQPVQESVEDHTAALEAVLNYLQGQEGNNSEVAAVGHRVVHGKSISDALLVTDEVIDAIKDAFDLAPLHNPGEASNYAIGKDTARLASSPR